MVDCTGIRVPVAGVVEVSDTGDEVLRHSIVDAFGKFRSGFVGFKLRFGRFAPLPRIEIVVATVRSVHHRDGIGSFLEARIERNRDCGLGVFRLDLDGDFFPVEDADLTRHGWARTEQVLLDWILMPLRYGFDYTLGNTDRI